MVKCQNWQVDVPHPFRYYAADTLQQNENVTNPAKCLTATDLDTGVVAGRCLKKLSHQIHRIHPGLLPRITWLSAKIMDP